MSKFIFLICLAAMTTFPGLLIRATSQEVATAYLFSSEDDIYHIDNQLDNNKTIAQIFGQIQSKLSANSHPLSTLLFGTDHNPTPPLYAQSPSSAQTPSSSSKKKNSSLPTTRDSVWYKVGVLGFPSLGLLNHVTQGKEKSSPRRINPYPIPKRIDLAHLEGEGIGYKEGYSKVGIIIAPEYKIGDFLPLLDLRGIIFNDREYAANVGLVGRFLRKKACQVIGINLFYDFRQKNWGNFSQLGGGIEVLSTFWEVHANAYFPIGVTQHHRKCVFDDYIGDYRAVRKEFKFACEYAFNADYGYYIVNLHNFQIYASAGLYFFGLDKCRTTSVVGVEALLRPQFKDYFSIELSVTHDQMYNTNYQINVIFTLPLYDYSTAIKKKKGPCGMPSRQVYQPVARDEIIILDKKCDWKFNWD